jgi:hypothetical protein
VATPAERSVPLGIAFVAATALAIALPLKHDPGVPGVEDWFDPSGTRFVARVAVWLGAFFIVLLVASVCWRYARHGTPSRFKIWVLIDLDWTPEGAAELHETDQDLQTQIDALVSQGQAQAKAIAGLEGGRRKSRRAG